MLFYLNKSASRQAAIRVMKCRLFLPLASCIHVSNACAESGYLLCLLPAMSAMPVFAASCCVWRALQLAIQRTVLIKLERNMRCMLRHSATLLFMGCHITSCTWHEIGAAPPDTLEHRKHQKRVFCNQMDPACEMYNAKSGQPVPSIQAGLLRSFWCH